MCHGQSLERELSLPPTFSFALNAFVFQTVLMMRILIAGAGIGGLTTAIACRRHGMDVTVLEAAPALKEVGAGIQISPNAMKVLRALKLENAVREAAFQPWSIEARMGESGRLVFDIPLANQSEARWGAPYLHIHRARYIEILAAQLPPQSLRMGAKLSAYEILGQGVRVRLESGERIEADVLIGADGIKSVVRDQMFGPSKARFTGNVAWRAVVPMDRLGKDAPRPTACAWFGRGRHAVTYRLGAEGNLANFVGVVERGDWQEEGWSIQGSREEAFTDFAGWHPTITKLIEHTDQLNRWALFDRPPLEMWRDGPVTLLGDAAHPMLPFLAQGAAMAVEDAYVLANALSKLPVEDALESYQAQRLSRTSKVQAASRANMGTFHKRSRSAQLATYGPMWLASRLSPSLVHRRMDWLYGHDMTHSS